MRTAPFLPTRNSRVGRVGRVDPTLPRPNCHVWAAPCGPLPRGSQLTSSCEDHYYPHPHRPHSQHVSTGRRTTSRDALVHDARRGPVRLCPIQCHLATNRLLSRAKNHTLGRPRSYRGRWVRRRNRLQQAHRAVWNPPHHRGAPAAV